MPVSKICPLMAAIRKNPNLFMSKPPEPDIKTAAQVLKEKPMGEIAAKTDAWWHEGYREAKEVEIAIKNGTYKAKEAPNIRREDGSINLDYFHSTDDDGLI